MSSLEKKSRTLNSRIIKRSNLKYARVVELVDTRDLKSLDRNIVPVQVRPRVPYLDNYAKYILSNSNRNRFIRKTI